MTSVGHRAHVLEAKRRTADIAPAASVTAPSSPGGAGGGAGSFVGLLLSDAVLAGLSAAGYHRPSPVQLEAIPRGKCGLDLIVQAKSGTGKTCVLAVLALEQLLTTAARPAAAAASSVTLPAANVHCQSLVLAPSREVALQIASVVRAIGCQFAGLSVCTFIGGTPVTTDVSNCKRCHIAVGTPGRLKHLMEAGHLSTDYVRLFVLDEVDKLMESSFVDDINFIYTRLPTDKQMITLSATYTEQMANQLTRYMLSPTFVRLNTKNQCLLGVRQFVLEALPPAPHSLSSLSSGALSVAQQQQLKLSALHQLLSCVEFTQCLVFCNYQTRAETLATQLRQTCGWPAVHLSAAVDQQRRQQLLEQLQQLQLRVLVATDLAARGLDSAHVDLVINMDLPAEPATLLHRAGRAGRYGSYGVCVTIVTRAPVAGAGGGGATGTEVTRLRHLAHATGMRMFRLELPSPSAVDTCLQLKATDMDGLSDFFPGVSDTAAATPAAADETAVTVCDSLKASTSAAVSYCGLPAQQSADTDSTRRKLLKAKRRTTVTASVSSSSARHREQSDRQLMAAASDSWCRAVSGSDTRAARGPPSELSHPPVAAADDSYSQLLDQYRLEQLARAAGEYGRAQDQTDSGPTSTAGHTNGPTNGAGPTNGPTNGAGPTNGPTSAAGHTNGPTSGAGHTIGPTNGPTSGAGHTIGPTSVCTHSSGNGSHVCVSVSGALVCQPQLAPSSAGKLANPGALAGDSRCLHEAADTSVPQDHGSRLRVADETGDAGEEPVLGQSDCSPLSSVAAPTAPCPPPQLGTVLLQLRALQGGACDASAVAVLAAYIDKCLAGTRLLADEYARCVGRVAAVGVASVFGAITRGPAHSLSLSLIASLCEEHRLKSGPCERDTTAAAAVGSPQSTNSSSATASSTANTASSSSCTQADDSALAPVAAQSQTAAADTDTASPPAARVVSSEAAVSGTSCSSGAAAAHPAASPAGDDCLIGCLQSSERDLFTFQTQLRRSLAEKRQQQHQQQQQHVGSSAGAVSGAVGTDSSSSGDDDSSTQSQSEESSARAAPVSGQYHRSSGGGGGGAVGSGRQAVLARRRVPPCVAEPGQKKRSGVGGASVRGHRSARGTVTRSSSVGHRAQRARAATAHSCRNSCAAHCWRSHPPPHPPAAQCCCSPSTAAVSCGPHSPGVCCCSCCCCTNNTPATTSSSSSGSSSRHMAYWSGSQPGCDCYTHCRQPLSPQSLLPPPPGVCQSVRHSCKYGANFSQLLTQCYQEQTAYLSHMLSFRH